MDFTINQMARQLIIVAQGYGADYFDQKRFEKEYRFKKGFEIGHLWGITNTCMRKGFGKFEKELSFIESKLPHVIEPKSFWIRNFSDWKRSR